MFIFSKELLMASGSLHGVYEWITPGTYTFTLDKQTKAMLYIVGSGSGRWTILGDSWLHGFDGAAFVGGVILPAGTYSVKVGDFGDTTANESYLLKMGDAIKLISADLDLEKSANLVIQPGTVVVDSGSTVSSSGVSRYGGYGIGESTSGGGYTTGYFKIEW